MPGGPPTSPLTNAKGVAKFTFKLNTVGVCKIEAFNKAGGLLRDQTLTVVRSGGHGNSGHGHDHQNGNGNGNGNGHGDKRAASAASKISFAGVVGIGLSAGGSALLLPGAGAMFIARRRRSAKVPS